MVIELDRFELNKISDSNTHVYSELIYRGIYRITPASIMMDNYLCVSVKDIFKKKHYVCI